MNPTKCLIVTVYFALVASCSSTPPLDESKLTFATRIVDNKLKQFKLTLTKQKLTNSIDPYQAILDRRKSGAHKAHEARQKDKKTYKQLVKSLQQRLEQNQYCKQGFWLINTDIYAQNPSLFGECNDTATQEDLTTHPKQSLNW